MTAQKSLSRGLQLGAKFRALDVSADRFDPEILASMLSVGHHEGAVVYVLRDAVPSELCNRVGDGFLRHIGVHGSNRPDDGYVKVSQIGSTQFDKGGDEYSRATLAVQADMRALFDDLTPAEVSRIMMDDVLPTALLGNGLHFGPARYKSTFANHCTMRAWLDNGTMSLHPHDDISQLECAKTDSFEIQAIQQTISFNTCIRNDGSGGQLRVWDLHPSPDFRHEMGVFSTGYPYPVEFTDTLDSITLDLTAGDSYFLNASFLHGVMPAAGTRITSGRFIGMVDQQRVVYWT